MRAGLMSRMLDAVLPEGSAVRDFVEVGGLLASGVSIALVCSSIGGVVMDTLGFLATLVLFFVAGFFFLTSKARPTPSAPARDACVRRSVWRGMRVTVGLRCRCSRAMTTRPCTYRFFFPPCS